MKCVLATASALALGATGATAGGIDRSGQSIGVIFEDGNYAEFSFGAVMPSVTGVDVATVEIDNVADRYFQYGLAIKTQLNDKSSVSVILDQPFGAQVEYPVASPLLGGTAATASSTAITALYRHQMNERLSFHGGVRIQSSSANVTLNGLAYGGLSGYNVDLASDTGLGYVIGAAYEIPDIALRVALTYNSAITHNFATVETLGAPIGIEPTKVTTPQSVNLDFQTGVAANTLVFGSVRWVDWSAFRLDPATFTGLSGGGLIDLDDSTTYTLGVGRKFNDTWSGAFSVSYEAEGNPLVSPLAPSNGKIGATLAAVYTNGNTKITTGINYTKLGDAMPETGTPDTARADFTGNTAIGIGVKVGYSF